MVYTKTRKYAVVEKVGMELEVEIRSGHYQDIRDCKGWRIENDGSIHANAGGSAVELVNSYPISPKNPKKVLMKVKPWLLASNSSMGFHIHLSFKDDRQYSLFATQEFAEYFKNRLIAEFPNDKELQA